jgi:ubiquinone/menaquinone biosynthesis C-methylase UbiE
VSEDHIAAARSFYDASAAKYTQFVGTEISSATEDPVDQSLLVAFVELVNTSGCTRVADVGCGPGRAAAFLAGKGLDVVGVDLSPQLLEIARAAHPDMQFVEGHLHELPFDDGALGGAVCWYSIIYTPPQRLGKAFAELTRVLKDGGYLLIAFQPGNGETVQQGKTLGIGTSITAFRHNVDDVTRSLVEAGLHVHATAIREHEMEHESSAQAFVIARSATPQDG